MNTHSGAIRLHIEHTIFDNNRVGIRYRCWGIAGIHAMVIGTLNCVETMLIYRETHLQINPKS